MKKIRKGDTVEFRYQGRHLYGEIIRVEKIDEETGEEYYRIVCGGEEKQLICRNVPRSALIHVFHI